MQLGEPVADVNEPAGHWEQTCEPLDAANEPLAQATQAEADALPCALPGAQARHEVDPAAALNDPALHVAQNDSPIEFENEPAGQREHTVAPTLTTAVNRPAAHDRQAVKPVALLNAPDGQAGHDVCPLTGLAVPVPHERHTDA